MAQFEIIVGSVLGATEYVADAIGELLETNGHQFTIHPDPKLDDIDQSATWVVCTSTHGAGDLPDNIQPFANQLKAAKLIDLNYLLIGLGDSSYDTFCYGAEQIQKLMQSAEAKLLKDPIHIDVLNHPIPEEKAVEWFSEWLTNH